MLAWTKMESAVSFSLRFEPIDSDSLVAVKMFVHIVIWSK